MRTIKEEKLRKSEIIMFIFSICIYGVVYFKTIDLKDVNIPIYLGFIMTLLIIFMICKSKRNLLEGLQYIKKEKILIIISIYFIYSILNYARGGIEYFALGIVKYLPILLIIIIPIYIEAYEIEIKKVIKVVFIIMGIVGIVSIIMYLLGNSYFIVSLSKGLEVEKTSTYLEIYGEGRLTSQFNHKSAFALYCNMGLILSLVITDIKKYIKLTINTVFVICIIVSNSIAFLPVGIIIYGYYFLEEYLDKPIKKIKLKIGNNVTKNFGKVVIVGIIIIGGIFILNIAGENRDLGSLNGRKYIWKAGVQEVLKTQNGMLSMPEYEWIDAVGYQKVDNPHNVFLTEGIENGIIGMIFFGGIYILLIIKFLKSKNLKIIGYSLILLLMGLNFDTMLKAEMMYIFWGIIGMLYLIEKRERNEK